MSSDHSTNPPSHALATKAMREKLSEAFQQDPALRQARIGDLLRLVPGKRALFSGHWQDMPVVFRLYLDDNGSRQAANQWAEMTRVCAYLQNPPYLINRPLHLGSGGNVLVLEHVDGSPLMQYMRRVPPEEKGLLTGQAVRWLHAYCNPSEEWREARVNSWIARAGDAAARQPHEQLRVIEAQVLTQMQALGDKIGGQRWRMSVCHGDFHPNNLLFSDDALTGIDIGGSDRIPVYKDMARFLVHLARREMIPSGRRRFGVDAAAFEEFAVVFGLDSAECSLFLPFMIAFEILFRVEQARAQGKRVDAAVRLAEGFLADLP